MSNAGVFVFLLVMSLSLGTAVAGTSTPGTKGLRGLTEDGVTVKFYCDEGYYLESSTSTPDSSSFSCVQYTCPIGYVLTLQLNPATNRYSTKVCYARPSYTLRTHIKTNANPCAFGSYHYKDDRVNEEYCIGLCYEDVYDQVGDHRCVLRAGESNILDVHISDTQDLSCPSTGDLVSDNSDNGGEQSITCNYK